MTQEPPYNTISPTQLKEWMDAGKNPTLIDTLPHEQFIKRHLPGARNACVYEVTFPSQVEAIVQKRSMPIVVCGCGSKSHDGKRAAEKLIRLGYRAVYLLEGGVEAWKAAGYPLEGVPHSEEEAVLEIDRFKSGFYSIDPSQAMIEWIGRNQNSRHTGIVRLSKGMMVIQDGYLEGTFEIDMSSIENLDLKDVAERQMLTDHLKSDDFFFIEKYPSTIFAIRKSKIRSDTRAGLPNIEIDGDLDMRGIHRDLKFQAIISPLSEDSITAEAHFDLDRTGWDVIYGSARFFEHLGMHLVYDVVSVQVRIVARRIKDFTGASPC